MNTIDDNQTQTVPQTQTPVTPTSDDSYLKRMEQTLVEAEQSVAAAVMEPDKAAPTEKQTTLCVSVVIPVYNERETIRTIIDRVRAVGVHYEIVVVDDFSLDGTREVLLELAEQSDIRVLMHGYNRGKGAALRTAFDVVQGDVVLIQDADLEYDPVDYPRLLAPLERGEVDVVYGSRFLVNAGQDPSRLHRLGNGLLTALSNAFTGQRLTDMETCYKVFRREILEELEIKQNRFGFEPEITAKFSRLGTRILEVPISYHARDYLDGKKIGFRDAVNAVWCIAKYGWRARR